MKKLNVFCVVTMLMTGGLAGETSGKIFGTARMFDATDPAAMALDIEGRYLYGGAGDWFVVYDVADPLNPKKVGSVSGIGAARQLVVQKGIAYVTTREYGVWIIDATDPTHPRIRSRFDCCELATGIDVAGDVCFCGQRQNGVEFIDVRDPDHPRHIAMRKTEESQSVFYRDGCLYSGEWEAGHVTVFDVRDMRSIRQIALADLRGYGDGVWARGDYLFAARGHHALRREGMVSKGHLGTRPGDPLYGAGHGLDIFDMRNPGAPVRVSSLDYPPFYKGGLDMWTPRTSGDLLVAAQTFNGIFAVDISDVAHPQIVDRWVSPPLRKGDGRLPSDCVGSVAIGNGAVYAAVRDRGFFVLACPRARAEPVDRGVLPQHAEYREPYPTDEKEWYAWRPHDVGQVRGVAIKGDTAYVACGDAGLYVLDILPRNGGWREVGKVEGRDQVYDVSICGNRLYAAEGVRGFGVYDISGKMPKEICRLDCQSARFKLALWVNAIDDTRILFSDRNRWFFYDISNLPQFRMISQIPSTCPGWDRYVMDRPVGNGCLAFNNCHRNVLWLDAKSGRELVRTTRNWTTLQNGLCAFGNDHVIFTRGRGYALLDPLQGDPADGSFWPLIELPKAIVRVNGKTRSVMPGIPRSDGRFVCFTSRIRRMASLYDFADPAHPVLKGGWALSGNPDVSAFHDGKVIIPCAYQGLLLQR